MGEITGIEWTDHTFNPWIGCTKVSAGCANCYAKTRDDRHVLGPVSHWGPGAPRHVTSDSNWRDPLKWARKAKVEGRRHRVFCASQADIFDTEAPVEARRRLWKLIGETFEWLDWQIVTKRPENVIPSLDDDGMNLGFLDVCKCWLGVSVENQAAANERIPELLQIDAYIRFLSCEPLLGSLDIGQWIGLECRHDDSSLESDTGALICRQCDDTPVLDWIICGGESGPDARVMHSSWPRSLRDQCIKSGIPFFFKQHGEWIALADYDLFVHGGKVDQYPHQYAWLHGSPNDKELPMSCYRVGKKSAGSSLDDVKWKEFPRRA